MLMKDDPLKMTRTKVLMRSMISLVIVSQDKGVLSTVMGWMIDLKER